MPRKRMISPSFWTDEKLGQCKRDERLLFMGLISLADDEGRGRANPVLLRSSVFPYDDLRVPDIDKWLRNLAGLHLIALYSVAGQSYYSLPGFRKHQTINKPTPSQLPPPSEGEETGEILSLPEDYGSTTVALPPKRKEEKRNTPLPPTGGTDRSLFGRFWAAYPKKKAKADAEKAFRVLKVDEDLLSTILLALEKQKRSPDWTKEGGQYVPYPATWLRGRRWEDEEAKADGSTKHWKRLE